MPVTPKTRQDRRLYQPRLPLTSDLGLPAAPSGPSAPRTVQNWRLDENTRRAGRRGVAAARAALAGAVGPGHGQQADAA